MKAIKNKLNSQLGESFSEVIVAVLIISLASASLLIMVNTSVKINQIANAGTSDFNAEVSAAEGNDDSHILTLTTTTATIESTYASTSIDITFYGQDADSLTSYRKKNG